MDKQSLMIRLFSLSFLTSVADVSEMWSNPIDGNIDVMSQFTEDRIVKGVIRGSR